MLIKNCIYSLIISISVFSVVSLIYSVKNKNKYSCNLVIVINSVFIIYLISAPFIISTLQLPVGFEMVYILLLEFITTIILIIAKNMHNSVIHPHSRSFSKTGFGYNRM